MDPVEGKVYLTHRFHDTPPMNTCGLSQERIQNIAKYKLQHLGVGLCALLWAVDLPDSLGLRSQNMFQHRRNSRFVAWCVRDVRRPRQHLHTEKAEKKTNETRTGRAEDRSF